MAFDDARPLESTLEKLDDASVGESTSVTGILNEFGDRSFGPILTVCGAVMITPLGSIPGVPAILAARIISSSLQLIIGRKKPWLPKRIQRLKISSQRLRSLKTFVRPLFSRVDGLVRSQMWWATTKGARISVAITSIF